MWVTHPQKKAFVSLPDQLYDCLKDEVSKRPDISMDLAVYLLHLILHPYKNMEREDNYINLCSTLLRKLDYRPYKCQDHLKFLRRSGFLTMSEYSNMPDNKGKCRGYKISENFLKDS
ncbi:hypothetical protein NE848_05875 [Gramella jeungdoensis]|uniref:Uncharacterized protein n=1 Tax=Gramella jeungdoensis TaxID=708091 RepID=A0ABT0YZJ5_9FLAO|nr:hypothetical protein [Gramella jeungdoensis]MCM8568896.1 hypothetical protein [Gramella jeungdoensis]